MVINARSLVKADAAPALYAELSSNNIDICFVSESWLNKKILSHLICPDGYVMVRKDRNGIRAGGGVAVICRKDWKLKVINANGQFEFETLWCKVTTPNSKYNMSNKRKTTPSVKYGEMSKFYWYGCIHKSFFDFNPHAPKH